jgi:periplasmic copper chaperone A
MRFLLVLLSLLSGMIVVAAQCASVSAPVQLNTADESGITVSDVSVRATTENGAVYMTLSNTGASDEVLLGATTDVARTVELHETTMDENDQMKMRPVVNIPIPAGGSVTLKPGGLHVMLIGLQKQLAPGDKISLTLNFERAEPMTVKAEVREDQMMMKHN